MSFFLRLTKIAVPAVALLTFGAFNANALSHTVLPLDTLYGISLRYDVPMNWILRANQLENETIHPGQRLEIPIDGFREITVQRGDTLTALSVEFNISVDAIRRYNKLQDDALQVGRVLKLPETLPPGRYQVQPGDSLLQIAIQEGLSLEELKMFNELSDDIIHPGDILIVEAPRPQGHRVRPGESIWTIAKQYNIAPSKLAKWNAVGEGGIIQIGEILSLFPNLESPMVPTENRPVALAAIQGLMPEKAIPRKEPGIPRDGEYFYSAPHKPYQPNDTYWEGSDASPKTDYSRAMKVLDLYKAEVRLMPQLSNKLTDWHIILDPGHGGLDPGAIVGTVDGAGNTVVVTEDEYVYDIALRLYRILLRHGAAVSMTIIAPDHHVRDGLNARQTFVNRKNEVYNDGPHNTKEAWRPVGTIDGLDLRKKIAQRVIQEGPRLTQKRNTLFISIHADNSADLSAGTAIFFDGEDQAELEASRQLAAALVPYMGAESFTRRQSLRVLQGNPADAAVLVEARNIHYKRNAWALRSTELREEDAQMMAAGILAWAHR